MKTANIIDKIKSTLPPGTVLEKPTSGKESVLLFWKKNRKGDEVLYYQVSSKASHKKSITKQELIFAMQSLEISGEFTRNKYTSNFPVISTKSPCNFVAIGGILSVLGLARYKTIGIYEKLF